MPSGLVLSVLILCLLLSLGLSVIVTLIPFVLLVLLVTRVVVPHTGLLVQHLYPLSIARVGHLAILRITLWLSGGKYHSRFLNTRTVLSRKHGVFIHAIPVLADNYCYAVICRGGATFLIDVGDATAVLAALELINSKYKYVEPGGMTVEAILSTHKHHDHTAGNVPFLKKHPLVRVLGAACEGVPGVTDTLKHGDTVRLLDGRVVVAVTAVPCHTRGSLLYTVTGGEAERDSPVCVFTGDTLFCGGCGAPFEAGFVGSSTNVSMTFVELLTVAVPPTTRTSCVRLFPGHEYTSMLLDNQTKTLSGEAANRMGPAAWFTLSSALFELHHKGNSAHAKGNGAEGTVPVSLTRELKLNPEFRRLLWCAVSLKAFILEWSESERDCGETGVVDLESVVVESDCCADTGADDDDEIFSSEESVFETFFSADITDIVERLKSREITPSEAADTITELRRSGLEARDAREKRDECIVVAENGNTTVSPNAKRDNLIRVLVTLGASPPALCRADVEGMNLRAGGVGEDCVVGLSRLLLALRRLGRYSNIVESGLMRAFEAAAESGEVTAGALADAVCGGKKPVPSKLRMCLPCCGGGGSNGSGELMVAVNGQEGPERGKNAVGRACKICKFDCGH
jgi:hydroxyacylglutathione hydrolase